MINGTFLRDRLVFCGLLVSLFFHTCYSQCNSEDVDVSLIGCPLTEVSLTDSSPSGKLTFGSVEWKYPYVDQSGEVDGHFILKGKGFGWNEGPKTIPGPLIRFAKGITAAVTVVNELQPLGSGEYETANIHTHGLHVSSDVDNPAVSIVPGSNLTYNYEMPLDHMGGTHWYHTHFHPLSELFVGSGAAGMLIVDDEDTGKEIPQDVLNLPEIPLIIQHINPSRLVDLADGLNIESSPRLHLNDTTFGIDFSPKGLTTEAGLAGMKEDTFFVNGFYLPKLELEQNKWYRLRFLHTATIFDVKMVLHDEDLANSTGCKFKLIARDGAYLSQGTRNVDFSAGNKIHLHPASRADLMVQCTGDVGTKAGLYDEFNGFGSNGLTNQQPDIEKRQLLLNLHVVAPETAPGPEFPAEFEFQACAPYYMQNTMSSTPALYGGVNETTRNDWVSNGMVRSNYANKWLDNGARFSIGVTPWSMQGAVFDGWKTADEQPDLNKRNITILYMGELVEWEITQGSKNHPVHIHINHFQLVDGIDDGTGFHQAGDWVDVIRPRLGVPVRIRFKPETFQGLCPIHCHNVDHADEGAVGYFHILPHPTRTEAVDPDLYNLRRPYSQFCNTDVNIVTKSPTRSPTQSPSGTPTATPTAAPSATPTTGTPTAAPTLTRILVSINPVAQPLYPHQGLIISSELLRASPNLAVEYCWTRISGDYDQSVSSLTDTIATCLESDDVSDIFSTDRMGPILVIKPHTLKGGQLYTYRLSVKQTNGAQLEQDSTEISFRVASNPNPAVVFVTPGEGVAGETRFDISLISNQTGKTLNLPLRYRFGIQRNTDNGEVVTLATQDSTTLSQVMLPFTDETATVSFASVVAYIIDATGAESVVSNAAFVRLYAPSAISVSTVTSGFNGAVIEEALQAQLTYASVLSKFSFDSLKPDVSAPSPEAKMAVLQETLTQFNAITTQEVFTYQIGELLMSVLNELSKSLLPDDDAELIQGVMSLFEKVLIAWQAKVENEMELAHQSNYYPNLGFFADPIVEIGYGTVHEFSSLDNICGKTVVPVAYLHALVTTLAMIGRVPGQGDVVADTSNMQSIARKEYANKIAGTYQPPSGTSSIIVPSTLLDPGQSAVYDTVLASVFRMTANHFCSEILQSNSTDDDSEDNTTTVSLVWNRRQTLTATTKSYQKLVSDILHLKLVHNSTDFFDGRSLKSVHVEFDLPYNTEIPSATTSHVKCGMWDDALKLWHDAKCTITSNYTVNENDYDTSKTVTCTCSAIDDENDFGVWVDVTETISDGNGGGDNIGREPLLHISWALFLRIVLPLFFLTFLLSIYANETDKAQASIIQKGAMLIFLSNKAWGRIKLDGTSANTKRSAFNEIRNADLGVAKSKRRRSSVLREDQVAKTSFNYMWSVITHHSILGTILVFNPKVSRVLRLALVSLACLLSFAASYVTIYQLEMEWLMGMIFASVFVGGITVFSMISISYVAKLEKRDFTRVAHMKRKSETLSKSKGEFNPDEDELLLMQCSLFMKKERLKQLKTQHDKIQPQWQVMKDSTWDMLWMVPRSERAKGMNRIYGGKVKLCYNYRKTRHKLTNLMRDHEIKSNSWARVVWGMYTLVLLFGSLFMIAEATYNLKALPMTWIGYAMMTFAASAVVEFAAVLVSMVFLCATIETPQPLTKQKRTRFYSWDSNMSTRSLQARKNTLYINEEDLEYGGGKRRKHRKSIASVATHKTARSIFGRYFGGKDKRLEDFSEDDFDSDAAFDFEEYAEGNAENRDTGKKKTNNRKSRRSIFSTHKSKKFAKSLFEDDEAGLEPDDYNYV